MYLKKLSLKNFKAIANASYSFGKLNVIAGQTWSGKTSLVQAIVYALTDYLEEKISEYVRWDAPRFNIELEAVHAGNPLTLSIEGGERSTKKTLLRSGKEFYNSDVIAELATLYDPNLTLYSSVALQHQTTSVLFDAPASRLAKLKTIFGMDAILQTSEVLKTDAAELKAQVSSLKAELAILETLKFEKQEEPNAIDPAPLQARLRLLEQDFQDYLQRRKDYDQQVRDQEKQIQAYQNLLKDYQTFKEKTQFFENKIVEKQQQRSNLVLPELFKPEISKEQLSEIQNQRDILRSDYIITEKQLKLAKQGKCETCGQDYKADVAGITQRLTDLKAEGKQLSDRITAAEAALSEYSKAQNNIAVIASQQKAIEKDIEDWQRQLLALPIILEPTPLELKPLSAEPEFDSSDLDKLKRELVIIEQQKKEIERIRRFNESQDQAAEDNKRVIKQKKIALEHASAQQKILEEARNLLDKEFSSYLLEEGLVFVEKRMNDFFSRIHSDYKLLLKKDKKSLEFFYTPGREQITPIGLASGFERQIISIAFRIALTEMQNFGMFVFDEIDGSASDERSLDLYRNLVELDYEQMFIITHRKSTVKYLVNECGANLIEMGTL